VAKVESGSVLVNEAGDTMREIVESVQRVTGMINEISAAGEEQRSGIEQVSQAVGQMDQVTQQNAALVEEARRLASAAGTGTGTGAGRQCVPPGWPCCAGPRRGCGRCCTSAGQRARKPAALAVTPRAPVREPRLGKPLAPVLASRHAAGASDEWVTF
jgi:methyl-accepting chemotaxis protein